MRVLILITFFGLTSGFTTMTPTLGQQQQQQQQPHQQQTRSPASLLLLQMSTNAPEDTADTVPLVIAGKNIELTKALTDYVQKRIGGNIHKLTSNGAIRECDVHLSVNKNPKVKNSHRVEITANLKGTTIHCRTETPDMYESIDAVAHALNGKLRKYKERRMDGFHGGSKTGDDLMAVLEEMEAEQNWTDDSDDEFADPEKPVITSVKSYDLTHPISLEEAVFALDYTDHDFYVFRNQDTDAINVVYKRNAGGIGHVEP